ncbi:MAG: hypothetical protein H6873_11500 [Hyphomicrobiaceae bacterium]|nr:hypothetical protein [Hyphomicrobiaceae bacterium]
MTKIDAESLANVKLRVARNQLGAATELFCRDKDSIAVHMLCSAACELLEGINNMTNRPTFSSQLLGLNPDLSPRRLNDIQRQFYNAFKHLLDFKNQPRMEDIETIDAFEDRHNDAVLFQAWFDYYRATGKLPIAVQVFQLWCYAIYPDWVVPNTDRTVIDSLFPDIRSKERREQKRRLARNVEKYRNNKELLAEPQTEAGPLLKKAEAW